jgi:hypothetical protein
LIFFLSRGIELWIGGWWEILRSLPLRYALCRNDAALETPTAIGSYRDKGYHFIVERYKDWQKINLKGF